MKIKLNNKGFAITATIYGFLILFLIVLLSVLAVLRSQNNSSLTISESIASSVFLVNEEIVSYQTDTSLTNLKRGKYYINVSTTTDDSGTSNQAWTSTTNCYIYVPEGDTLYIESGKLKLEPIGNEVTLVGDDCADISDVSGSITGINVYKRYVANSYSE